MIVRRKTTTSLEVDLTVRDLLNLAGGADSARFKILSPDGVVVAEGDLDFAQLKVEYEALPKAAKEHD